MTRPKVMLVSFAPDHSSSINRIHDCTGGNFDLEVYDTETNKVEESIAARVFSLKIPSLMTKLLRSDATVFWAWGLDACFIVTLAALIRRRVKLIWDITDINPRVLAQDRRARLLRAIEWTLLKRADLLLLTSDAFYTNYYLGHIDRVKVEIIENLLPGPPPDRLPPPPTGAPWRIVFTGIFRSPAVLRVLRRVADMMEGEVAVHLHGYPDRTFPADEFEEATTGSPSLRFHGRFKPNQLAEIYATAHLGWAFVDPEANDNEQWLLSNRIYNSVAFSRPALANDGTHVGAVVRARRIGATCRLEPSEIVDTIRELMADDGAKYAALVRNMPAPETAYLTGQYRTVIERLIDGLAPQAVRS